MTNARKEVIDTPELLELIMLRLSTRDLLLAQLVSPKWRDMISNSPNIQQALFFRAGPQSADSHYRFNDLLAEVFPLWFQQTNPFDPKFNVHDLENIPWAVDQHKKMAVLDENASWRRMLICQPRLKLEIRNMASSMGGDFTRYGHLSESGILTMGILYDVTQEWLVKDFGCFGVSWGCFPRPMPTSKVYEEYMQRGIPLQKLHGCGDSAGFSPRPSITLNRYMTASCRDRGSDPIMQSFESKAAVQVTVTYGELKELKNRYDEETRAYWNRKYREEWERAVPDMGSDEQTEEQDAAVDGEHEQPNIPTEERTDTRKKGMGDTVLNTLARMKNRFSRLGGN